MLFWTLSVIGSWLVDLVAVLSRSDHEKDLEILILRHQIGILQRNVKRPKVSRLERLFLAVLADRLQKRTGVSRRQLKESVLIFTPRTVLRWHAELVRRTWTYKQGRRPGRPRTSPEVEELILTMARQTPPRGSCWLLNSSAGLHQTEPG